jgi:hypothetical protein
MTNISERSYHAADPADNKYGGAREVVEAEFGHIKDWRGLEPRAGLALSGGGIRSASFGLGILQALAYGKWLREFDYLSTVSGGGYSGASLSYLLHLSRTESGGKVPKFDVSQENFPYLSYPMVGAQHTGVASEERKKGALLRRLRQNAKYLTPGNGITVLSLLGVVMRNSVTSIVVHGGLIALALLLLVGLHFLDAAGGTEWPPAWRMNPMMWACAGIFGLYALLSGLYIFLSGFFDTWFRDDDVYRGRRWYERVVSLLLWAGIASFIVAALPWLYDVARQVKTIYALYAGAASTVFGVAASVWAFLQTSGVKKPKLPVSLAVAVASVLLLIGFVLLAFWLALRLEAAVGPWTGAGLVVVTLFLVGWIPSVNYLSVHRYYRDRLMEAFMPDKHEINEPEACSGMTRTGNETMLGAVCGVGEKIDDPGKDRGPYHLICANVVLVSSKNPRYRGRGGDSFVFAPLFSGSHATGWAPTNPAPGEGMTLATAMAISGAAVNPGTGCGGEGVTRQPVLSVLMSMLNIRLGYWLANPRRWRPASTGDATPEPASPASRILFKPNMLYPGLLESFGRRNLREDERYLLLTDGGHFENLGVYELLRRRLKLIVVCDGAADANYAFSDLANALEKARADFGALVAIAAADLDDLVPRAVGKEGAAEGSEIPMAKRGYLVAPIRYAPVPGSNVANASDDCGLLIYITTTFFKELDASLYGYRKAHPAFPDEPTSDQFFDEKQFESYRELGYQTAWRMMNEFSSFGTGKVMLNGIAFPRIHKATECTDVPSPFQDIRQEIRRKAAA